MKKDEDRLDKLRDLLADGRREEASKLFYEWTKTGVFDLSVFRQGIRVFGWFTKN